ncbi:MAG: ABC transporter permease [Oligoflexia bacterium]|nr:ABC transporter permease [Oligoflexia bacterium]
MIRLQGFKTMWRDMITFPKLGIGAYRVWYRDFFYFKKFFIASIFWSFTEPLLYIVAFGYGLGFFVGKIDGVPYLMFLAPAILCTTAMQGAVFESTYSSFTKLRVQKTYETIMMTPVSVEEVVAGEIFWGASKAFFGVLGVMTVFLVLGMIHHWQAWLALPVLLLLAWCISAMSMVVTSYARDYDSFTYFFSIVVTPMSLLAGTFFPLSQLPKWAQAMAWVLPLTHGVKVSRELFLGRWDHSLWINLLILVIMAILFTNWSIGQTRRRLVY